MNSRPITYVHHELNEPLPLTPASFLIIGEKHLPEDEVKLLSRSDITNRYVYRERVMSHLWHRFQKEYLFELSFTQMQMLKLYL